MDSFNKTAKVLILTNIATIIGAVVSMIWNFAVMTQRVEMIQSRLDQTRTLYETMDSRIYDNTADIQVLESGQILIDGRVLRLEDIHFNGGG